MEVLGRKVKIWILDFLVVKKANKFVTKTLVFFSLLEATGYLNLL